MKAQPSIVKNALIVAVLAVIMVVSQEAAAWVKAHPEEESISTSGRGDEARCGDYRDTCLVVQNIF